MILHGAYFKCLRKGDQDMLVDNALFDGPSTLVADNVDKLPSDPDANALVYLLQQDGDNAPGLYMYSESTWKWLTDSDPVV